MQEIEDPAPLSVWSRVAAGISGVTLCGAGGVAVFATDNQAGCVALILAGGLFILLTIGGNPLHSLGFGETQMRFAVQKRRQQVINSVVDASPEDARRTLEVLQAIDPGVTRDASFRYHSQRTYINLIVERFMQLFPDCTINESRRDRGNIDFDVMRPDMVISVDVLFHEEFSQHFVPTPSIWKRARKAGESSTPVLIVSNIPLEQAGYRSLQSARDHGVKIAFVHWRDERDDAALHTAAEDLFVQLPEEQG
ncbi:hypothetical protein ACFWHF_31135 [Streptomyces griseoincarnatus]